MRGFLFLLHNVALPITVYISIKYNFNIAGFWVMLSLAILTCSELLY